MLDTGTDAAAGTQGFPHGLGGADDVIAMPLQCSTQWDGLGHIFDHGMAWNGRRRRIRRDQRRRPRHRHRARGSRHRRPWRAARRGPVPAAEHRRRHGRRAARRLRHHRRALEACIAAQGASSAVGRGDLVLVRTGQLRPSPARRLGRLRGRAERRACRSPPPAGCTAPRSPRSPPTPGASRCGPTSSTTPSSRCTRSSSRTWGCRSARCGTSTALAADCAADGVLRVLAHRRPAAHHRRRRLARQPHRREVDRTPTKGPHDVRCHPVSRSSAPAWPAPPPPSCSPRAASTSTSSSEARPVRPRLGHHPAGQRPARAATELGVWDQVEGGRLRVRLPGLRAPGPDGTGHRPDPRRADRRRRVPGHRGHVPTRSRRASSPTVRPSSARASGTAPR